MNRIAIGTSGWSYEHWQEIFYPNGLRSRDYLSHYATFFDTVEVNSTFYHLPFPQSITKWRQETPNPFIFAVKASRFITHQKRLLDPRMTLEKFYKRIDHFGSKLGPILFQLPASFKKDVGRLSLFLEALNPNLQHVFEFRDPSWFDDEVYTLLKEAHIPLCFSDMKGVESPLEMTADFIYIRLHGPQQSYQGRYGKKRLERWGDKICQWAEKREVFVYFNNDQSGDALMDAWELKSLIQHEFAY